MRVMAAQTYFERRGESHPCFRVRLVSLYGLHKIVCELLNYVRCNSITYHSAICYRIRISCKDNVFMSKSSVGNDANLTHFPMTNEHAALLA